MFEFDIREGEIAGVLIKLSDNQSAPGWTESPSVKYIFDFFGDDFQENEGLVNAGFSNFPNMPAPAGNSDIAVLTNPLNPLPQFNALNQNTARNQVCVNNGRDPQWVDIHDGGPVDQIALDLRVGDATNPGRYSIPIPGTPNTEIFQAMQYTALNNRLTPEKRYIFGFFRALSLPIQVFVKEYSGPNPNQWERVAVRIGWLENNPRVDNRYIAAFTDQAVSNGRLPTGAQVGTLNTLERLVINPADVPANRRDKIHWIELQGRPFADNTRSGNAADIWFKVCSAPGNPLPTTGFINIVFVLDYSGSIATSSTRKTTLINRINNVINEFEAIRLLYNENGLFRYALRVIGAPGATRDSRYENSKYHAYGGDGQSDGTTASRFFTNSQRIVSFEENLTAEQFRARCLAILNNPAVRYAYTPIWRGISEAVLDFQQAKAMTELIPNADPSGDINILLMFSDGDETVGGYVGEGINEILTRRKAIIKTCKRIVEVADLGSTGDTLTEIQKGKIKAKVIEHLSLDSLNIGATNEELLVNTIFTISKLELDSTTALPTIKRNNSKFLALWNKLISKEFNLELNGIVDGVVTNLDVEPDENTLSHRIWDLIKNYKIGGQFIVAQPGISSDHPLHKMQAVSGDPTDADWLENQIKNSIINRRWCHTQCRLNA